MLPPGPSTLEEWWASVSVTVMPSAWCEPPLLNPTAFSTPWLPNQPASSTIASTGAPFSLASRTTSAV